MSLHTERRVRDLERRLGLAESSIEVLEGLVRERRQTPLRIPKIPKCLRDLGYRSHA